MREVVMNDKSNLLQLEEHFYQLVDVDEPNTFRNLFPYEEIPKSGLQIPHSVMGSSPVLRIPPNRS